MLTVYCVGMVLGEEIGEKSVTTTTGYNNRDALSSSNTADEEVDLFSKSVLTTEADQCHLKYPIVPYEGSFDNSAGMDKEVSIVLDNTETLATELDMFYRKSYQKSHIVPYQGGKGAGTDKVDIVLKADLGKDVDISRVNSTNTDKHPSKDRDDSTRAVHDDAQNKSGKVKPKYSGVILHQSFGKVVDTDREISRVLHITEGGNEGIVHERKAHITEGDHEGKVREGKVRIAEDKDKEKDTRTMFSGVGKDLGNGKDLNADLTGVTNHQVRDEDIRQVSGSDLCQDQNSGTPVAGTEAYTFFSGFNSDVGVLQWNELREKELDPPEDEVRQLYSAKAVLTLLREELQQMRDFIDRVYTGQTRQKSPGVDPNDLQGRSAIEHDQVCQHGLDNVEQAQTRYKLRAADLDDLGRSTIEHHHQVCPSLDGLYSAEEAQTCYKPPYAVLGDLGRSVIDQHQVCHSSDCLDSMEGAQTRYKPPSADLDDLEESIIVQKQVCLNLGGLANIEEALRLVCDRLDALVTVCDAALDDRAAELLTANPGEASGCLTGLTLADESTLEWGEDGEEESVRHPTENWQLFDQVVAMMRQGDEANIRDEGENPRSHFQTEQTDHTQSIGYREEHADTDRISDSTEANSSHESSYTTCDGYSSGRTSPNAHVLQSAFEEISSQANEGAQPCSDPKVVDEVPEPVKQVIGESTKMDEKVAEVRSVSECEKETYRIALELLRKEQTLLHLQQRSNVKLHRELVRLSVENRQLRSTVVELGTSVDLKNSEVLTLINKVDHVNRLLDEQVEEFRCVFRAVTRENEEELAKLTAENTRLKSAIASLNTRKRFSGGDPTEKMLADYNTSAHGGETYETVVQENLVSGMPQQLQTEDDSRKDVFSSEAKDEVWISRGINVSGPDNTELAEFIPPQGSLLELHHCPGPVTQPAVPVASKAKTVSEQKFDSNYQEMVCPVHLPVPHSADNGESTSVSNTPGSDRIPEEIGPRTPVQQSDQCVLDIAVQNTLYSTTNDVNVSTNAPTPGKGDRLLTGDKTTQTELPQNIADVHLVADSPTEGYVDKLVAETTSSSRSRSSVFYIGQSMFPRANESAALGDLVQQMRQQNARLAHYLSALNSLFSQRNYNQATDQNDQQLM